MEKREARLRLEEILRADKGKEEMSAEITKLISQCQFRESVYLSSCLPEAATKYISVMTYPVPDKKHGHNERKKFHRALLSAVVFEHKKPQAKKELGEETVNRLINDYGLTTNWPTIESTIKKATTKLMNMLFIYQSYQRYCEYLVMSEPSDPPANLAKYIASTARAYPHLGYDPAKFQILLDSKSNLSEADEMKTALRYWSKSKSALHLLDGYYHCYLKLHPSNVQHIRHSILNPEWVIDAVKYSQLKLGTELLDIEMNRRGAPKHHRMEYDPTEAVFVDLLWDQFIYRGIKI